MPYKKQKNSNNIGIPSSTGSERNTINIAKERIQNVYRSIKSTESFRFSLYKPIEKVEINQ